MPGVFTQQRDVSSGLFGAKRNFWSRTCWLRILLRDLSQSV
jgi:hypothetical protein